MTSIAMDSVFPGFVSSSPAGGSVAERVTQSLDAVQRHAAETAIDWRPVLFSAINEIARDCARADWDGYDATEISETVRARTLDFALSLRERLPSGTPAPELIPESDGEISVSWQFAPDLVFSVSVGLSDQLHYAGLFGGGVEQHGVERMGSSAPRTILEAITRLCEGSRTRTRSRRP